jgi:hypothetical protein
VVTAPPARRSPALRFGSVRDGIGRLHPYLDDASTMLASAQETDWIPLPRLLDDRRLLREVVTARVERRVAAGTLSASSDPTVRLGAVASALYQTLVWRALGPAVVTAIVHDAWEPGAPGAAVRFGEDGSIRVAHVDVDLVPGEGGDGSGGSGGTPAPSSTVLSALRRGPWDGFLVPLRVAFHDLVRFGPRQLPGNAASVVASTIRLLVASQVIDAAAGRSAHARIAAALELTGLGHWLDGTGLDAPSGNPAPEPDPWFRRSTCCLWLRVSEGTCGDCSLRSHDELADASATWWASRRAAEQPAR